MSNCEETRVKLTNPQLNKLKSAAKKQDWNNIKNNKEKFSRRRINSGRQTELIIIDKKTKN